MRKLNLTFLIGSVAVLVVLGVGIRVLHDYQVRSNVAALLGRARKAEAGKDLEKTEQSLSQYLNLRNEDAPTWEWYARVVDQRDTDQVRRERVFLVHEEALRHDPENRKLERRCAELALELQPPRYQDARRHLEHLLEQASRDSQDQPVDAELEDLLGQCDLGMTRYEDAERWFVRALEHDPQRVDCTYRLARLRRSELRRNADGDATIQTMIAQNPKSGRAYAVRWRYAREFGPSAETNDIQKALELAPDDPEVLSTAASASEEKLDLAAARAYLEKAFQLDPRNTAVALRLAGLEARLGRLDRAEAVLRKADRARPSLDLALVLAETLILQGKIAGTDQAEGPIARLRDAGLGDTLVRYLEARILVQQQKWAAAIPQLEMARTILSSDRRLTYQLDLMLADCFSRVGSVAQRLDALRRAAEDDGAPDSARVAFARELTRAGKLDQALAILRPLSEHQPELRLELVSLLIQLTRREPKDQQNWQVVEQSLNEAERANPQAVETATLLRADVLAAQDHLEDARSLLAKAQAKDPRNLRYRLALARLIQRIGPATAAMATLDQAEKDLGLSAELQLARLEFWDQEGGDPAKSAVAKLAETCRQLPAADRPLVLDRLGSVALRLGDRDLARRSWHDLAELEPDNPRVWLELFELALDAGDHREAENLVAETRKVEGEGGTAWRFAQAALLIDRARRGGAHELEEARRLAAEIAERQPESWIGPSLHGEIAELSGATDQAIDAYTRAVELGNVRPALVRRLVGLLNQRGRFDEIDRLAQRLRKEGAAPDDISIVEALNAIRKQDFDRALALARQVFSPTSTNPSDHLTLGRFSMAAGRAEEAGREFRRAVELGPGIPDAWLAYVQHLVQTGAIDQARAAVDAARKALPADRATLALAQCSLYLGDSQQAEPLIQKALDHEGKAADPAALRLAITLALSRNRLDQVDEYLDRLDRVSDLAPDDKAWANRTRAARLLSRGRPADRDQALELVQQNLTTLPDSIEDQGLKAVVLASRPDGHGEAIAILEPLAAANRLGPNERFLLAQLYLGQRSEEKYRDTMLPLLNSRLRNPRHLAHFIHFQIDRNQLDPADRWLTELKRAEPRSLAALDLEARLLALRNRRDELLAILESRLRQVPDQTGPVAELLDRHGYTKAAETAYRALVARNPRGPEPTLALASFLARHDRVAESMEILARAWTTVPPEQVASAALSVLEAPSTDETQRRQVEAWVSAAIRKRPDLSGLETKLGLIYVREGRSDEAEELWRRLLRSSPENAEVLNDLAWLLALRPRGKTAEALELIDRAIHVLGPVATLVDTQAVVLIRAGETDKALQVLGEAQARDPGNPSLARHLAWAHHQAGNTLEARKALRQAEELGWTLARCDPLERSYMEKLRSELRN